MAQDLTRLVAGNHLWYAREGTTIDGNAVNATTAPPDNNPESNWTSMGCIESMTIDRTIETWTPKCPSPGTYVDADDITLSKQIMYNFTFNEVSNVFFQLLFNTAGPVPDAGASNAFEPNDSEGVTRGWWKIQTYNQTDALTFSLDVWGSATIVDTANFNTEGTTWGMQLKQLDSAFNAGGLYNHTWTAPA